MKAPKKVDYRKILTGLESNAAMNLKCGACASCTGGGGGTSNCKCTGVKKQKKA